MKKNLIVLGMIAVWFLNILPAKADAIWEPRSEFYEEHASECEYDNRQYTADGPDGVVKVYVSPENSMVVDTLDNGMSVCVLFTYTDEDGIRWGVIENYSDESKTGWLVMDYMNVVYDYISFKEEYGSSFVAESGALGAEAVGQTIKFWPYPGAQNGYYEMEIQSAEEWLPEYSQTFVDEEGHKWGYIGYYYGIKHYWICLDNPTATAEELYPNGIPARGEEAAEPEPEEEKSAEDSDEDQEAEIVPKGNDKLVFMVSGLVAAVAAVTGGLLVWLKKKKKF